MGTFALANEIEFIDGQFENNYELFDYQQCTGVKNDCGMALLYCWNGELDPDKVKAFRDQACADKETEDQDAQED
ncbi:hypothetical protein [Empedobacter brevis]|nr:hypothetical protein [Empedobacter brevis]